MMLMMQVEKRFGNASHWVEALQLVDICGGPVGGHQVSFHQSGGRIFGS